MARVSVCLDLCGAPVLLFSVVAFLTRPVAVCTLRVSLRVLSQTRYFLQSLQLTLLLLLLLVMRCMYVHLTLPAIVMCFLLH